MNSREIGPSLTIIQLNIEGISQSKSEYLAKLGEEYKADVIVLQETHSTSEADLAIRGKISGYKLVGSIYHRSYGSATFVKEDLVNCELISTSIESNIHTIVISVGNLSIMNVYKPPNVPWPSPQLQVLKGPAIYVGDFNSHHTVWGYATSDKNGEDIYNWSRNQNLHLIFDAKDIPTFHSGRWDRGYNPDICFVSEDGRGRPIAALRKVLRSFPRTQHKPILFQLGIHINLVNSVQKPRWNFKKASWATYKKNLDTNIRFIPPEVKNYQRFVDIVKATAKRNIPRGFRKEYIPGWSNVSNQLYKEYQRNSDPQIADDLLQSLDVGRRDKWNSVVENINFTHSSRKAWSVLRKLGSANVPNKVTPKINPNLVASHLLRMSKVPADPNIIQQLKKNLKRMKKKCQPSSDYAREFSMREISTALKMTKSGKAAGFDGMYNEFLKHMGPRARKWLLAFFSNILQSGILPPLFKKSKVIAILKPGKPDDQPESYRPISLLSVCYKLLERLVYNRISTAINSVIPQEQAGFRPERNCCDQVMALTSHIEIGFQKKLKTGVAYIDLSAAYDTVWKDGLLYKFMNVIPCLKMCNLLNSMLSNRHFSVYIGDKSSRSRILNNGLPQGSVLAPLLFTLYISDIPITQSRKFMYADDIALAFQSSSFSQIESTLASDLDLLDDYCKNWRLRPNPSKTQVNCYHLSNALANENLKVDFKGITLKHNPLPKYLGVTLDRSLTYREHLENVAAKAKSRINIIQKLAGTSWGADASTLRTASLALVYSVAEYCSPVWLNCHHVNKIDTLLNRTLRIITGTLKSTPLPWLHVLSNIAPPNLRRESCLAREWTKIMLTQNLPIYYETLNLPTKRLSSRCPIYEMANLDNFANYSIEDEWKSFWKDFLGYNHFLIEDPNIRVQGFHLPRKQWKTLNRLRTGQGRNNDCLFKWGLTFSPLCECREAIQSMDHIINECATTKFPGRGINEIHLCSEDSINWIQNLYIDL